MIYHRLTIHCSATKNGDYLPISTLRAWHRQRGFYDIGYHFIIQPDGAVEPGRPLDEPGAHVLHENDANLGICLIGLDRFTRPQFEGLRGLLDEVFSDLKIPVWQIFCHRDFPSAIQQGKTCPNMRAQHLMAWYLMKSDEPIQHYVLSNV